jgi:hypothetical protein
MDLDDLYQALQDSRTTLKRALEEKFPKGARVRAMLNVNQIVSSRMTVIGHDGEGYVRCSMRSRGEDTFVRSVFYQDIDGWNRKEFVTW